MDGMYIKCPYFLTQKKTHQKTKKKKQQQPKQKTNKTHTHTHTHTPHPPLHTPPHTTKQQQQQQQTSNLCMEIVEHKTKTKHLTHSPKNLIK